MTNPSAPHNEERWRAYLNGADPAARAGRALWQKLPSPPRCELCAAPFRGPFVPLLRLIGKRPFNKNPRYCDFCMSRLIKAEGGAEAASFMTAAFPPVSASYEELVDASPEEIFDAWTTAEELKSWFGPGGFQTIEAVVEARPGGRYRLVMRTPDGSQLTITGA